MDFEQMLEELAKLKYEEKGYSGSVYKYSVINEKNMDKVENVIRKYMNRNPYIEQVNMLSAKIYVYEQIIAKSNFAPFVDDIRQRLKEVERPHYHFGCGEKLDIKTALRDCKHVFDGIIDDDTYQEADQGLIMYYANEIVYALKLAAEMEKENNWTFNLRQAD